MRCFIERDPVLERVHDAFGCVQPDDLVQGRILEAEIHECDTSPLARGDAGNVPRGLCRPGQIVRHRHERHQRRVIDERRNEVAEPRERQLTDAGHCPGW